jgi:hypothetical protein
MADWRIDNCKGLRRLKLKRKKYRPWSETWNHDHCAACWATFAEFDGPDYQHEGYATCDDYKHGAEYDWVCMSCFSELKEEMDWMEVS